MRACVCACECVKGCLREDAGVNGGEEEGREGGMEEWVGGFSESQMDYQLIRMNRRPGGGGGGEGEIKRGREGAEAEER